MPFVSDYFSEPISVRQAHRPTTSHTTTEKQQNSKKSSVDVADLKRPSDFRRVSVSVQRALDRSSNPLMMQLLVESNSRDELGIGHHDDNDDDDDGTADTPIKDDVLEQISIFRKIIDWTIEHVNDKIDLPMANYPMVLQSTTDQDDERLVQDRELIGMLEELVMDWERHILKVVESYLAKVVFYFVFCLHP